MADLGYAKKSNSTITYSQKLFVGTGTTHPSVGTAQYELAAIIGVLTWDYNLNKWVPVPTS